MAEVPRGRDARPKRQPRAPRPGTAKAPLDPQVAPDATAGGDPEPVIPRERRARPNRFAHAWKRVQTPWRRVPAQRLARALQAQRPRSIALALVAFVIGFSLDDLRILRVPGYLAGLCAAVLFLAVAPLVGARRLAIDHLGESDDTFAARCEAARRVGALGVLAVAIGALAWLVFFSAGVPPWAR